MDLSFLEYAFSFVSLFMAVLVTLIFLKNLPAISSEAARRSGYTPYVTVLIPAFNESEYIAGTIESVLSLDYPKSKLEVMVLDDGSTDGTFEAASAFSKKGVRVLRKKNSGKADTMNQGIRLAKGELIASLDADSYVSPYSLRRMLIHFDSPDVAAVSSAVKIKDARNLVEEVQRMEYLYALFSRKVINYINAVQVTPGPFSVFRKDVLIKLGGFDKASLVEDQEIALRMQKNGYRINSSFDSDVYTEIPHTFSELLKQRTRWQRGGFWNSMKYLDMVHPRYGDLGLVVLPFCLFSYLAVIAGVMIFINNMLSPDPYQGLLTSGGLIIGPMHVLMAVWLLLALFWFYFGMKRMFANERLTLPSYILYLLLYPVFTSIFWIAAAYAEIRTGGKFSW
jgi:biofilm PGA synthesis N-glycosyltransferase PgaC